MALNIKPELRLTQKLIMTPQLQQAIRLLQLSRLELSQLVAQELTENPVLEEDFEISETPFPESSTTEEENKGQESRTISEIPSQGYLKFIGDDYFEERESNGRDLGYFTRGEEERPSYEQVLSKPATLIDHLMWQLRLSTSDKTLEEIGELIIGDIDENGYLQSSLEEIASLSGRKIEDVERALTLIQSFDPSGVAARDLKECLLIQISHLGLGGSLVEEIVKSHLADLEKKRYQLIAKRLKVPLEHVLVSLKVIEGLEPKPARSYFNIDMRYVTPDIYVQKIGEDYVVSLNEDGISKLKISPFYRELLRRKDVLPSSEREYIENKLRSAIALIKGIEQRSRTVYKVAKSIVSLQKDFLEKGYGHLKPMTLKDVAAAVSMHESTISRVTANKYIHTPQGLFELKFFFSGGLPFRGEQVSTVSVREMIKKMVSGEDPRHPLSDQKIVEMLREKDITIARRTVAKYRRELNIPPTNIRREIG